VSGSALCGSAGKKHGGQDAEEHGLAKKRWVVFNVNIKINNQQCALAASYDRVK
jgi:hypothetical protein